MTSACTATSQTTCHVICGSCCFAAGTSVWTANGTQAIETLQPGDAVLVFNQRDRSVSTSAVYAVSKREVPSTFVAMPVEGVLSTPDHLFFVEGSGWVAASDLEKHDRIATRTNNSDLFGVANEVLHYQQHQQEYGMAAASNGMSRFGAQHYAVGQSVQPMRANVERAGETTTVYNVYAEDTHTYFVGQSGMLVHACMGMNIGPSTGQPQDGTANAHTSAGQEYQLPPLAVLDAFTPSLSVLATSTSSAHDSIRIATLACVSLGEWVDVLGTRGSTTVLLDHTQGYVRVLNTAALRRIIEVGGNVHCNQSDLLVSSIPLARAQQQGAIPFRAVLSADGASVYVSYFGADAVEHYRFDDSAARVVSEYVMPALPDGRTGVSAVAMCGTARASLCVTFVAYKCDDAQCLTVSSAAVGWVCFLK